MKRLFFFLAFLMAAPVWMAAAPLTPEELGAHLRQIEAELDSGSSATTRAGLPAAWDVATPEHEYSISTEPLRSLLADADIREAKRWLDQVARNLESFSTAPADVPPNARGRLDRILARPEFAGVHPPTAWDVFRQRAAAWIASLIQRFFTYAAQNPTGGQILFWVLVAAAVGLLAAWLIRFWTQRDAWFSLPHPDREIRSQTWMDWVRAAREAASRGDAREAIRCNYWAGVSRMQEMRALPQDETHTPREYLRLISKPHIAMADAMTSLTAGLERFWYAGHTAGSDDFEASLKQLEALGCKLD